MPYQYPNNNESKENRENSEADDFNPSDELDQSEVLGSTEIDELGDYEAPETEEGMAEAPDEDVSMYYPDGDAEHIYEDDGAPPHSYTDPERAKQKKKIMRKNARLTKSQIILIAVIFVVYTAVLLTASWIIFYKPKQPDPQNVPFDTTPMEEQVSVEQGPPLEKVNPSEKTDSADPEKTGESSESSEPGSSSEPGEETDPPKPVDKSPSQQTETPAQTGDSTSEGTKTPAVTGEYIAKEGLYNILVIGRDDAAYLADAIMIVNVNTNDHTVTVMQIPRDTLVTIGVATNKINAAFSTFFSEAYNSGVRNYWDYTMDSMASLLERSLCINIHHTVLVNLSGFENIVNILGGVDVYVPNAMYYTDPEQGLYIDIPAGWNHLNGYNAECFVRFRSGYLQQDLGRVNAQKIFLTALFQQVKATMKAYDISTMTQVFTEMMKNVETTLSISDIMYFAKECLNIELENITMITIPGNVEGSGTYYVINRLATLDTINRYFNIYQTEISNSIFDRNLTFCFSDLQYICNVYYAPAESAMADIYSGEEISEDSIYIP